MELTLTELEALVRHMKEHEADRVVLDYVTFEDKEGKIINLYIDEYCGMDLIDTFKILEDDFT